jgi:hypothetical protein
MKINKHISGALALNSSLGRSITFFMTALLLAGVAASTGHSPAHGTVPSRIWNVMPSTCPCFLCASGGRYLLQAELALRDIRRTIPSDNISTLNASRFDVLLADLKDRLPQLHGLFIYDAQGNMKATALGRFPPDQ